MENVKAKDLFNTQFKFSLNEEVRHKGDNKHGMSSDMGLLILRRILEENSDDDNNVHFTRNYICRMIRFSGSGDLAQFKESELLTVKEYNERAVKDEQEREYMRNDIYNVTKEIFDSFGVKRSTEIYLKNGEIIDKENVYKVTGFKQDGDGTMLIARMVAGEGKTTDEVRIKSKSEFVLKSEIN
jgi:hypothetical protein